MRYTPGVGPIFVLVLVLRNMAMARGRTDRQGVEYEHAQRRWVQEVVTRVRNDVAEAAR